MNKAARTRQYIITQVAPIFNKQGYVGTALSDIEIATGLTKGAIYGNFGSKNALAQACFDHNIQPLQKGFLRALSTPGNSINKLKASITFYRNHFEEVAALGGCPLMNTSTEADDTLPFLKQKVQTSIMNWQKELAALITTGKTEGCIATKTNPDQFAISAIAIIEGGILLAKAMDDANYFYRAIDSLDQMIERELRKET